MFSLKDSLIYQAVKWEWFFNALRLIGKIAFILFALFIILFFFSRSPWSAPWPLFLSTAIISQIGVLFFERRLKHPKLKATIEQALANPQELNVAEFLSFETAKAFSLALGHNFLKQRQAPGSTFLFLCLLDAAPQLNFVFQKALISQEELMDALKRQAKILEPVNLEETGLSLIRLAQERKHSRVEKGDLLIYLSKTDAVFKRILVEKNMYSHDIAHLVWWLENLEEQKEKRRRFWDYENLVQHGSIATDWAVGYSIALDEFSVEWTQVLQRRSYEKIIGHDEEVDQLERILSREQNNSALLIGETGSGRKSIVHLLSKRVLFGQSSPALNHKRVIELDLLSLVARAKTQSRVNSLLEKIFQEVVRNKNIILVIDELPNFISFSRKAGTVDISSMLFKYLRFPDFRLIGICDFGGYHSRVEKNLSLASLFERVIVTEVSQDETILILENLVPYYEAKTKRFISYPVLVDIVRYSDKYIADAPFPQKAINLLDEVMVYVARYTKSQVVLPEHVAKIVSEKTRIPVGEMETTEKQTLLNLEDLIHQRIINQEEAVREVAEAMRRARAEITIRQGPIGAFLFLGPTGVGKTETSKALTEIYFGDESRMIRLDMSEFQKQQDIYRLIGGGRHDGLLSTQIRERPFSLILLDEIEKTHPDILNLFLQVLDEGFLTDGNGRKVDFKNSIIIATSNAGYKIILDALKERVDWSLVKERLLDHIFEKGIFRPEFINRFDAMVVFSPLSKENLLDISALLLNKLTRNLSNKHIEFRVTEELRAKVVDLSYNPIFGAREMRRVIQDRVENVLARAMLSGEIGRGDAIIMDGEFKIKKIRQTNG